MPDVYPGTDFDAGFVQLSAASTSPDWCAGSESERKPIMTKINGITFYMDEYQNGAAGHQGWDKVYHTYHGQNCIEVLLGLRTSGYGASDEVKSQVNAQDVFRRLNDVLATFKLSEPAWETYLNSSYFFEFSHPAGWAGETESHVDVKGPLDGYKFTNAPAGVVYTYNAKTESWDSQDNGIKKMSTASGVVWYQTGVADGLGGSFIALVPDKKSNKMIQIFTGWGTCLEEGFFCEVGTNGRKQAEQEINEIMSTFKFTK
jgi:hypothetical protein